VNALWDLWGKLECKPLWQLLSEMDPQVLVSAVDFSHINDVVTREEVVAHIREMQSEESDMDEKLRTIDGFGMSAYFSAASYPEYRDYSIKKLLKDACRNGFNIFKIKVGEDFKSDRKRYDLFRETIGKKKIMIIDVMKSIPGESVSKWVKSLTFNDIPWVEFSGKAITKKVCKELKKGMRPIRIETGTGSSFEDHQTWKAYMLTGELDLAFLHGTKLAGINEILAVYFMAWKLHIPICPHTSGLGLSKLILHLQVFDYLCMSGSTQNRIMEFTNCYNNFFVRPITIIHGRYFPTKFPGIDVEMIDDYLLDCEYPYGKYWRPSEPKPSQMWKLQKSTSL